MTKHAAFLAVIAATSVAQAEPLPTPPAPPPVYHPHSGPWILYFDEAGNQQPLQTQVVDQIMRSWRGSTLGAFLLCFRGLPENDPHRRRRDMQLARETLLSAGARMVADGDFSICDRTTPNGSANVPRPYVEIWGISVTGQHLDN